MKDTNDTNIYNAHLDYLERGFDPLPIPPHDGHWTKGPVVSRWQQRSVAHDFDEQDYEQPKTNLGMNLGSPKNLTDIDCDSSLAVQIAAILLPTLLPAGEETCKFGHRPSKPVSHYLYYTDTGLPIHKMTNPLDKKDTNIEYRCLCKDGVSHGEQTVFPPSIWWNERDPDGPGEPIDFAPGCGLDQIKTVRAQDLYLMTKWIAAACLMAKYFPESGRNECKRAWARVFCDGGFTETDAVVLIGLAYRHSRNWGGDAVKDERDVTSTYKSRANEATHLFGYPKLLELGYEQKVLAEVCSLLGITIAKRVEVQQQSAPTAVNHNHYRLNDTGNGQRFVDKFKDIARYSYEDNNWLVWDGARWKLDSANHVQELAKTLSSDIQKQADSIVLTEQSTKEEKERRDRLLVWANRSGNTERLTAMAKSASSIPAVLISGADLNTHDHLLNCKNTVVNLYTGEQTPHDKALYITQMSPYRYIPGARSDRWANILAAITRKHPELAGYLKRYVGYCAQGSKGEELLVLCHGVGGTGKGTFWSPIQQTLGSDYVRVMAPESLLKQNRPGSAASGDIARLEYSRLVLVNEFNKNDRLQENFLKAVSGGDTIVGRALFKGEREIRPTFQFNLSSNRRPIFDANDTGNQRRWQEIPFDNKLADDPTITIDTNLKKSLADDVEFHEAVLAWIVEGCIEFKRDGLQIPDCVRGATTELFKQNDVLGEFWSDCMITDKQSDVPCAVLRSVYATWCFKEHVKDQMTDREFSTHLSERGIKSSSKWDGLKKNSTKVYAGVALTDFAKQLIASDEDIAASVRQHLRASAAAAQPDRSPVMGEEE